MDAVEHNHAADDDGGIYEDDEFESSSSSSSTLSSTVSSTSTSASDDSSHTTAVSPAEGNVLHDSGGAMHQATPEVLSVIQSPKVAAAAGSPASTSEESWVPMASAEFPHRVVHPTEVSELQSPRSPPHQTIAANRETAEASREAGAEVVGTTDHDEVPAAALATSTKDSHSRVSATAAAPRTRQQSAFQAVVAEVVKEVTEARSNSSDTEAFQHRASSAGEKSSSSGDECHDEHPQVPEHESTLVDAPSVAGSTSLHDAPSDAEREAVERGAATSLNDDDVDPQAREDDSSGRGPVETASPQPHSPPDEGLEFVPQVAQQTKSENFSRDDCNQATQQPTSSRNASQGTSCGDPDVEQLMHQPVRAPQRTHAEDDSSQEPSVQQAQLQQQPVDARADENDQRVVEEPARNPPVTVPVTYEYGAEDDDVLRALMILDPTMRRLHFEAELISKKRCGDVDRELDALIQQVGGASHSSAARKTSARLQSASSAQSSNTKQSSPRRLLSSAASRTSTTAAAVTDRGGRPPFHVNETAHGLPHYDALRDEHCQEFLSENRVFQEHWKRMQENLKPNHRVGARVRDALIPATSSSRPSTAGSVTFDFFSDADCASPTLSISSSRPGSARAQKKQRGAIPAIRECLSSLDTGTSVDVANAITFFQKRREQQRKGLPQVVRNPNEALRVQLHGPTGTMRASKGEPWPPERQGKQQAPVPPRVPRPSIVLLRQPSTVQRQQSLFLQGEPSAIVGRNGSALRIVTAEMESSANSSPTHATAGGRSPHSPSSGRPASSPKNSRLPPSPSAARSVSMRRSRMDGSAFSLKRPGSSSVRSTAFTVRPPPLRAIPGEVPAMRYNSRSPYLQHHEEFTTHDALYFPDAHAMHHGTVAPNLYYLNRRSPAKSADQMMADRASLPSSPRGDGKPSLSILTETHINIIMRSEDYSRRQLKKGEQDRIIKLSAVFIAKTAFLRERQRQLMVVSDSEAHKRKEIMDEETAASSRLEQQRTKDEMQALRNEEVFPVCRQYARGEGVELGFASSQSTIVDLRWSGGDGESAAFALLAFDHYDRFVITIAPGESFRCPISGKPVIRSWGNFRFKSSDDSQRESGGKHRFSLENRTTLELLLQNLSPQCSIQRFVFVAMHPTKTGAPLTPIRRAYLTIREPHVLTGIPSNIAVPAAVLSPGTTPTAKIDKVQVDTITTEVASSRLSDHPGAACYTIGSVLRQWGLMLLEDETNQALLKTHNGSGTLSAQSSVDELTLRPVHRTPSRGARTMTSVSPNQRPLSMHLSDDRFTLAGSMTPSQAELKGIRVGSASSKHQRGGSSRNASAGTRQQMPCTWKYVCHDMCDPSVANIHRLPGVLESVLFINADDVWNSYSQTISKVLRACDEFYEKIFRFKIELHESIERVNLAARKHTDRELVLKLTAINPMKAAMLKSTAQHLQPAPPGQLGNSLRTPTGRRRSGWAATLGAVKATVALGSKPGARRSSLRPTDTIN
jgi:hypothetical protein